MFLNRTPTQCPAGKIPNTEADWDAFSAMASFAPGTNMEQEKTIFLNQCKFENDPRDTVFDIETGLKDRETGNNTISPALILAAAAAFFFAG
jgi:hypothetical protein